jgi:hypothetical protein
MKARVFLFLMIVMMAGVSRADAQGLGYAIAGPAGFTGFFGSSFSAGHAAAGGELLIGRRAGIGAEYGIFASSGGAFTIASINGVLHILSTDLKRGPSPFVTGGYARLSSGEGDFNAWNVGAGVDTWIKPRVGVRVEIRDHIRPDSRGDVQYWTMRVGLVIR